MINTINTIDIFLQNSLIILFIVFIYDVFLKNIVNLYFIHNKMNMLNKISILPFYVNQSEYFEKIEYDLNHVVIDIKDECTCPYLAIWLGKSWITSTPNKTLKKSKLFK